MSLSTAELERGWVEFKCDTHGFLVATGPAASVKCACGKSAYTEREGQRLNNRERKSLHLAHKKTAIDSLPSRNRPRGRGFTRKAA